MATVKQAVAKGGSMGNKQDIKYVSKRGAITIIYYLMAVDGEICQSEEEKFDAIAHELDDDFDSYKDELIAECGSQINKASEDDEYYYEIIQDGVQETIDSTGTRMAFISRLYVSNLILVWNLLSIAFSDGKYTDEEKYLVKYVTRKMNIDGDIFLEMENAIKALLAIKKEEQWLKTTSKPYSEIEPLIKELSNRREVINNSVEQLITM